MSNLSPIEKEYFEELFGMDTGYILENVDANITNAKFKSIVENLTGIDIYHKRFEEKGTSKANRLRVFWERELDVDVASVLNELLNIYAFKKQTKGEDPDKNAIYNQCRSVVQKLSGKEPVPNNAAQEFLKKDFGKVSFDNIDIEETVKPILAGRLNEAKQGLEANNPLSVIFMCGSILEGLLLAVARQNPKAFNTCKISPKGEDRKVLPFNRWSLSQLIDVANDLGYLDIDTKKFSHALRDFRNYIHPNEQMKSGFAPTIDTAKICLQVLRAAIVSLQKKYELYCSKSSNGSVNFRT